MQPDPIHDYDFDIAPSKSAVLPVVASNFFYLMDLSHSGVKVKINEGKARKGALARGHNYGSGFEIVKVEVFNTSATVRLTGLLQVGRGAPIDNLFNVQVGEVTPQLRPETPSVIEEFISEEAVDGIDVWVQLLPADDTRALVDLSTDAAALAYWAPAAAGFGETANRNIVTAGGLSGVLTLATKSAIFVMHKEAGKTITATVHRYSA